jgi:hypothetical protein
MADQTLNALLRLQEQIQAQMPKTDRERANARISSGRGTEADSVFVGLKPRPTAPAPEKPYSPGTELERTMWRLTHQDFTPEERSAFGQSFLPHQGYAGSLQARADSTRADQEFNMFGGQFAQGKQPEPTALMREAQFIGGLAAKAARERGLPEATAAADSVSALTETMDIGLGRQARATAEPTTELERRYGYLNKTEPGTPERADAQRAIDVHIQKAEPNVSYEEALDKRAATASVIDGLVNKKPLSEIGQLVAKSFKDSGELDLFNNMMSGNVTDEEARTKLMAYLNDKLRFYDQRIISHKINALSRDHPPADNKGREYNMKGVGILKSDGVNWIPSDRKAK